MKDKVYSYRFICDVCNLRIFTVNELPDGWAVWKYDLSSPASSKHVGVSYKDLCPKCIQKIEIKEVFK